MLKVQRAFFRAYFTNILYTAKKLLYLCIVKR